jgi:hypothetical protein
LKRFSNKYYVDNTESRTLYKAYGLRFIINVNGKAGQFSVLPFMLTIGAGIGLLSISELIADMFLLNCSRKRSMYRRAKEQEANDIVIEPENEVLPVSFRSVNSVVTGKPEGSSYL